MTSPYPAPIDSKRGELMARVRSRGNQTTEMAMVRAMRAAGLTGWRRHLPMPGTPDFAFPRSKLALFVDGCFWHGCPRCYTAPKHNAVFWARKVERNRARDKRVSAELREQGWKVVRIWEHSLREPARITGRIRHQLVK